ncbi:acetoin:2,6-dichlorophenolindophenol oxidoreductase subunit beta [mine drainage metagenome]|uniref:Acetoin:2,6-dichlorophenolindophenol oxidoreductase subunit beta n=1 Tax=mine drainage metagenome TaxID=410659 RepID=A0A1J5PNK5_9ZZZZ
MHVPGIKVLMPATPYDAKGMLIAASRDGNPIMFIEDRWLYDLEGEVPEGPYETPIGKAIIRREGRDLSIIAASTMVPMAMEAAKILEKMGIDIEVVDLRSIKPWDQDLVSASARKTGRVIVADSGWSTAGISAEITATLSKRAFGFLKQPIERFALPDIPAPTSRSLERAYYPTKEQMAELAIQMMATPSSFILKHD